MDDTNRTASANAHVEQINADAALPEDGGKAQDTRVDIHVRSYRRLKHDPDGVSAKAALDGIVARGILTDDSSEQIAKITFEGIKSKDEKTIIEITEAKL